jgi:hypothetical protein
MSYLLANLKISDKARLSPQTGFGWRNFEEVYKNASEGGLKRECVYFWSDLYRREE